MHYTGTIWRPPYEASSLLLEVTAGCTHHRCKFCTLYADLPFRFRMSPMEDIEADLKEAQKMSTDILEQCGRLDRAGIRYSFFYLTGISGEGRGEDGVRTTAAVCNKLHPALVGVNMLTVYPDSGLYQEIRQGNWKEESETEKYREVRALVEGLEIPTEFAALGASNAFQLHGVLPEDRKKLLAFLDDVIKNVDEDELRRYRESVHHL